MKENKEKEERKKDKEIIIRKERRKKNWKTSRGIRILKKIGVGRKVKGEA